MIAACPTCARALPRSSGRSCGARGRAAALRALRGGVPRASARPTEDAAPMPAPRRAAPAPARAGARAAPRRRARRRRGRRACRRRGGDLVLVAIPTRRRQAARRSARGAGALRAIVVHDGVEAILAIQRQLPRRRRARRGAAEDVRLPGLRAREAQREPARRSTSCWSARSTTRSAIAARRARLYGADAYVERARAARRARAAARATAASRHAAPAAAGAQRRRRRRRAARRLAPQPRAEPARAAAAAPRAAPPARAAVPPAPAPAPQRRRAPATTASTSSARRRSASRASSSRTSCSTTRRSSRPRSRRATCVEALDAELAEGRTLFAQRIDARVRAERDYLAEELLRVARTRGG